MIKPIHPVQNFKNLPTSKKIATIAGTAAGIAATVLAVKKGSDIIGKDQGVLNKFVSGICYGMGYAAQHVKKGVVSAFEIAKTEVAKLPEQISKVFNFIKDKFSK